MRKNLDISRLKFTGWEPKINLDIGINQVIKDIENSINDDLDNGKSLKNFFI